MPDLSVVHMKAADILNLRVPVLERMGAVRPRHKGVIVLCAKHVDSFVVLMPFVYAELSVGVVPDKYHEHQR